MPGAGGQDIRGFEIAMRAVMLLFEFDERQENGLQSRVEFLGGEADFVVEEILQAGAKFGHGERGGGFGDFRNVHPGGRPSFTSDCCSRAETRKRSCSALIFRSSWREPSGTEKVFKMMSVDLPLTVSLAVYSAVHAPVFRPAIPEIVLPSLAHSSGSCHAGSIVVPRIAICRNDGNKPARVGKRGGLAACHRMQEVLEPPMVSSVRIR